MGTPVRGLPRPDCTLEFSLFSFHYSTHIPLSEPMRGCLSPAPYPGHASLAIPPFTNGTGSHFFDTPSVVELRMSGGPRFGIYGYMAETYILLK